MVSPAIRFVLTAILVSTFYLAFRYGLTYGPEWTYWGVIVSGILWLLASLAPVWGATHLTPAALNSTAASAAVFAGLTALSRGDIMNALRMLKVLHP